MKHRVLINLLLLTLCIALATFVWLSPGQNETHKPRLIPLDISVINTIRIERQQAASIELTRHQEEWQISSPIKARALAAKVERLLKISQIEPPSSYPLDQQSLQRFGLEPPLARILYNDTPIAMGGTESVHSRRYVRSGHQLHLLDDTFLHHLNAPLSSYIDNRLLADGAQIIALQTPSLHLQQTEDNAWHNTLKPKDAIPADAVQMLFDEWRFARAINVDTTLQTNPAAQVVIQLSNQRLQFTLIQQKNTVLLINQANRLAYRFSLDKYKRMTTLNSLEADGA